MSTSLAAFRGRLRAMPGCGVWRDVLGAVWVLLSFLAVELYLRVFLGAADLYGFWISAMWAAAGTAGLLLFPRRVGQVLYGIGYFVLAGFAVAQVACVKILGHMIWLSDIVHAGEGADYTGTITSGLNAAFWLSAVFMIAVGVLGIFAMPRFRRRWYVPLVCVAVALGAMTAKHYILADCLAYDAKDKYNATVFRQTINSYGIYSTFYDARKVYSVCGYYQLLTQDVIRHHIRPRLPAYQQALAAKRAAAAEFYAQRGEHEANGMTGLLEGKNVVLVLMETMDDFLINEDDTPTICRLMREGINFTDFYTPIYSSIHTFNAEFCANTGYFLPTSGLSSLGYSDNDFSESLPNQFRALGYSAEVFHYNTPIFYNRGVMLPAIGFEAYNSYEDYVDSADDPALYDDCFMLKNDTLREKMFGGEAPFFDYIITRNAHTPFTYDDDFAAWGLEIHPEYIGKYENETLDVIESKARLVDDMFAMLLSTLEEYGHLEDTVIVAFTDHYAYPISDQNMVMELSGVDNTYLEMRTPCFIWSYGMEPVTVGKTLNTSDLAPTLLNLFGIENDFDYLGRDAFDDDYPGYAVFSDGTWLSGGVLCSGGVVIEELWDGAADALDIDAMEKTAAAYIRTSDAMIETDYYRRED